VKRRALVRHLEQNGCRLLREGANHSIFVSRRSACRPAAAGAARRKSVSARYPSHTRRVAAASMPHPLRGTKRLWSLQQRERGDGTRRGSLAPPDFQLRGTVALAQAAAARHAERRSALAGPSRLDRQIIGHPPAGGKRLASCAQIVRCACRRVFCPHQATGKREQPD